MLPSTESPREVAEIIQLAVAPVFLLAGVGAFLNVCALRLARIVDRARSLEPQVLSAHGEEHDHFVGEIRILDRRMALVSHAITASVLSAVLTCAVVVVLFGAGLTGANIGMPIALLFSGSMVSLALGFTIFLFETRLGSRAVRIRRSILDHQADDVADEAAGDE